MSTLKSLLSSIEGGSAQNPAPATKPAAVPPKTPQASTNGLRTTVSGSQAGGSTLKRKADGDLNETKAKVVKKEPQAVPARSVAPARPQVLPARASTASPAIPYHGTSRPSGTPTGGKPPVKPIAAGAPASPKPGVVTKIPSTATPTATAKKSTYKDILERAKAAQQSASAAAAAAPPKPVEKLTKKERRAQELAAKKGLTGKAVLAARSRSAEPASGTAATEKKKPAESSYKGTMRPSNPSSYKGTMQLGATARDRKPGIGTARPGVQSRGSASNIRQPVPGKGARGTGYYDYSDEEDEEEEEDYDSEGSSDMEAGIYDMDREEAEALKAAKREDWEELQAEEAHKRDKRRRLLQLGKASQAKKNRRH